MTNVVMRPEHWKRLAEMARAAEPRLSSAEAETLIHSDDVMSFIARGSDVEWSRDLIEKHAPRLKD